MILRAIFACSPLLLASCSQFSKAEPAGALGYVVNGGTTTEKPIEHLDNDELPPEKPSGPVRWQMKF
jgi:hypothetical protein